MSMKNKEVGGHKVFYEEDAAEGINYLEYDIQDTEAKVFFDQAKSSGSAEFEDEKGQNYTLLYKNDNNYWLYKREADKSGWF
jgi:hypothetical protein